MAYLEYHSGNSSSVQRFPIIRNLTRIGRGKACDICIDESLAAKEHAHILRDSDGYTISAIARGSGLIVNGKKTRETKIAPGDRIQIGNSLLIVQEDTNTSHVATEKHSYRCRRIRECKTRGSVCQGSPGRSDGFQYHYYHDHPETL